jgi:cytoskeletal protein RodZ
MNSYRLCLRAVIVVGLGAVVAATSACGSSSGSSSAAPPATASAAPVTDEAVPSTTEEPPSTDAPVDTAPASKPKADARSASKPKLGTASVKSVCKAVEPKLNKAVNDMIAHAEPAERAALNKTFKDLAVTTREQADRASKASLSAALRDIADASEDFAKVKNVSTADKEGTALQNAIRRAGAICEP